MPKNKSILDTNIWVSYIIKSKFEELVKLIIDNDLEIYTSQELIAELYEVLNRPKLKS